MLGRRLSRGTTLIEVMAAVFVLMMTITAAGALFPLSSVLRDRSGGFSQAASIAQHKVEQIRHLDAGSIKPARLLTLGIIDADDPTSSGGAGVFRFTEADKLSSRFAGGQGQMLISGMGTSLVRIDVEIHWKAFTGKQHKHRLTTFVADKTPWRVP